MSVDCQGQLHERLPARREHIARLRHDVVEFASICGASDDRRDDIALAVSEALSNAVLHAYVDHETPGVLAINAWMHGRSLIVVICDEGDGLLPRAHSPGLGLGLWLVAQVADDVELESLDATPGLRVRMRFFIG